VALTCSANGGLLFVDGALERSSATACPGFVNSRPLQFGVYDTGGHVKGTLDEVLLFNRALTPTEIAAYTESRKPYGTSLVPGAQADFDDVRVTEVASTVPGAEAAHAVPTEILGPRPHSDTPCPMESDDGTWADRDDLCGVKELWRLDGNGAGVLGHPATINGTMPVEGRYGDTSGAERISMGTWLETANLAMIRPTDPWTLEAWTLLETKPAGGFQRIVQDGTGLAMQPELLSIRYDASSDAFAVVSTDGKTQTVWCLGASHPTSGQWIHVAAVLQAQRIRLFVNGTQECDEDLTEMGDLGFAEAKGMAFGNKQGGFDAFRLDDVLLHNVAKSPDYLYRRAHPGVPTVRFLAHTEAVADGNGRFPWLDYDLNWANDGEGARHAVPLHTGLDQVTKSVGLLSPALGYAGWWRFNEGSGTVAVDSSSNRRSGALLGGAGWVTGLEGPALHADGVDDRVSLPNSAIDGADNLSVEIAASFEGTNAFPALLSAANETEANELLISHAEDDGRLRAWVKGGVANQPVVADLDISVSGWHTIGVVRNGGSVSILEAGDTKGSGSAPAGALAVTSGSLQLGVDQDTEGDGFEATDWWQGTIDSVRLMSRALTPDEMLHYPLAGWAAGGCLAAGLPDADCDQEGDVTDCDAGNPAVFHGARETCNALDDDCDGQTDEAVCCTPNPCTAPPAGSCDGTVATAFPPVGSCALVEDVAACTYAPVATDCAGLGKSCSEGECVSPTPILPTTAGQVVISELMIRSLAGADPYEWIEVANPTAQAFDLGSCVLTDGGSDTATLAGPLILAPHGLLLLVRTDSATEYGRAPDSVYGTTFGLGNTTDSVSLRCGGVSIDDVLYNSAWVTLGASIQLSSTKLDAALNDDEANWCVAISMYNAAFKYGTPGAANYECSPL
jgi:hypothetical protein